MKPSRPRGCLLVVLALALPLLANASVPPAAAGPVASAEFRVNTTTAFNQWESAVAVDADGDYVVAWRDSGIYTQRYDAAGVPLGIETRVDLTPGAFVFGPQVAMGADGDYVVTWGRDDIGTDSSYDIYLRRFDVDGTPLSGQTVVNTTTLGQQLAHDVAMDADGDFVVTWASLGQDGSGDGVYAQRFDADGTRAGPETRVHTTTESLQTTPSVGMDAEGDYVIAWYSWQPVIGVYTQRYDAAGSPLGGETRISTVTTRDQREPDVAMDADGDYVVSWAGLAPALGEYDIYSRRFDAAGDPQGAELTVNTTTANDQRRPKVAVDADGDHVVVWTSDGQDGSGSGVYAQRYDAAGQPVGGETRTSVTTSADQEDPHIAMDADGAFVATWTSELQDGSHLGVFGRRFRGSARADLAMTQSASAATVPATGRISYRVRVANVEERATDTGFAAIDEALGSATGIYVVSTITSGAAYVSSTGPGWDCTPSAGKVMCRRSGPLVAAEAAPDLLLTYNGPADASGSLIHTVRVASDQLDPVPTNHTETERTRVMCSLELSQPLFSATEASSITATVSRTGSGCGTSGVSYATSAASATAGTDFASVAGTLVLADGETSQTFAVPIIDDGLDERTELFNIQLAHPTGAVLGTRSLANGSIGDNDDPPRVNFTAAASTAAEPFALVELTVRLSEVSGQDIPIVLAKGGTATYLTDYFAPKRITIPAGQRTITFDVEVADDNLTEGSEVAVISLANPAGSTAATLGSQKTYRLTLTDDD